MKGDRMPTILSPLANAMGEEYTDSWFDFLLDPVKLKDHLENLKNGKSNHPNVSSIIKTLLKQFEKYNQQQQQQQQPQLQQDQAILNLSNGISIQQQQQSTLKRSKLIIDLIIDVCTNLKFSLDDFEKNIPIKHQRIILEQLESKENIDIEYQTFLNRWILRGIIKGTPIKYLLSNYSSSSSSPNLVSTQPAATVIPSTSILGAPMTPPSSPPPTPPSFISLSTTTTSNKNNELNNSSGSVDTSTSLEELFYKSNLFLNEWINDNYDTNKPSDSDQVVPIVLCELGEFQFYKENFNEAKLLFDKAHKIINTQHILNIIEKSNDQIKRTPPIKGIVGNKLQQLSDYKDKIHSLIIACKTIDLYDQDSMDISNISTITSEENNINYRIEKAISKNNLDELVSILNKDITNTLPNQQSISISFRYNLETNILPPKFKSNQDKLLLLNIYYGNLIKSIILESNFYSYQYDLNKFKYSSKEECEIFFKIIKMVSNELNQNDNEKIKFLLFKIYNIIICDQLINQNQNYFIQSFKSYNQSLYNQFNNNNNNKNNTQEIIINNINNNNNNNNLILNNFIKENQPSKIKELLDPIKNQFNLNEQQLNAIYYQKALDLFEIGDIENSKTILKEYITTTSSTNSTEYQLYLYDLLLKNYKKDPQQQTGEKKQIKSRTIIVESFKSLLSKYGIPSEYIMERIFSTLLNSSKWETVKSLSNLLKNYESLAELVNISNSIASIGKIIEIENKEKKIQQEEEKKTQQEQNKLKLDEDSDSNKPNNENDNNSGTDVKMDDSPKSNDTNNGNKLSPNNQTTNNNNENSNNDNNSNDNSNNNNNSSSNSNHNGYSDNDSDMDIDDDDLTPTYTNATTTQSTNTSNKNPTNKSKATINSKSEESIISFINSIIPKYEQKSIHWTFIESNGFYSKNSNQTSGLLNLLEKKSLYNRIILIFVGLIHSIQICKKTQNDINLALYNEYSHQIANTITFPNKYYSVEIETALLNVYLDTLMRMNKIFGLALDKDQLNETAISSSLSSSSGITLASSSTSTTTIDDNEIIFNNGKYLIYIGDIYFEKKYYKESLKYYLLGCAIENAFYSDPKKTIITTTKYFTHLARRLFDCFYFLKCPMQAIVVSQFFGNLNQTCSISFKIIQEEFYQLDSNYFQYIWEIPLLEILINTFSKQKEAKKVYILNQIISNPNINEFNHPDIRKNYIKNTKNNFWKAVSSSCLLGSS